MLRDDGDEFLGAASAGGEGTDPLSSRMQGFLDGWRGAFAARFSGAPPLAPRILVGNATGRDLVRLRDGLGRQIGRLKHIRDQPITGFVIDLGDVDGPGFGGR